MISKSEIVIGETSAEIFRVCLKMIDECHGDKAPAYIEKASTIKCNLDGATKEAILDALNYINPDDRDTWIHVGMAIYNIGLPFDLWDNWSKGSDKYNDGRDESTSDKWNGFIRSKSRWNAGTIFRLAKDSGWIDIRGKNKAPKTEISIRSVKDIQESDIPPIGFSVAGIIPNGYTVISAAFKIGKSWLVLWICTRVAQGLPVWGMSTEKGSVLYLDLEGCENHTKERINMILQGEPAPSNFYVSYDAPTLDDGLIDYLDTAYQQIPELKLIVIDVLAMVQYQTKRGETAYQNDYRTGTALKHFADDKGISIVAVTHTTKSLHPDDIFMNTTGTNGVTASADAIITIAKEKRQDNNALMAITGRRVREQYFNIHLDSNCIWQLDGNAEDSEGISEELKQQAEYEASEIRNAVIAVAMNGTQELRARSIIEKAFDQGIYITQSPKDVGLFIHRNQVRFMKYDNVKISIIKNGQGSSLYRLENAAGMDHNPFIDTITT
ncbi:MAG: AAA family ATPase [Lachnospiraceae bacterium]|nr:AAA family ATPase [Lachnospiraceae bacterium]